MDTPLTINPAVLADLMIRADYKPGSQPSADLLRLVTLVVERCAVVADAAECPDSQEAGTAVRAEFGMLG